MHHFKANIELIGINPYVLVPDKILKKIMEVAGKEKGSIQINGTINQKTYKQTLVKFKGAWRFISIQPCSKIHRNELVN